MNAWAPLGCLRCSEGRGRDCLAIENAASGKFGLLALEMLRLLGTGGGGRAGAGGAPPKIKFRSLMSCEGRGIKAAPCPQRSGAARREEGKREAAEKKSHPAPNVRGTERVRNVRANCS